MDVVKKRQLEVARKTLNTPDAILGVMGGMTKEKAKEIIDNYERKENESSN